MLADLKLILGGVAAAVLLGGAGIVWYQHHEVSTLTKASGATTAIIADLTGAASEASGVIAQGVVSASITDATQVKAQQDAQTAAQRTAKIAADRAAREKAIHDAYAKLPKTSVPSTASISTLNGLATTRLDSEADQIAAVRIASMWQTYCPYAASDSAAVCAANTQ